MTARVEQRVRHRRRVIGRRGSEAAASKITVPGTYDGSLRKFFGSGAVLQNVVIGNSKSEEPTEIGSGTDGTTRDFSPSDITYK
ncbi:hypothetical protein [Streptomyces sp. SID12488]|uniref:hypothetical protein n=1 Tax=Streptomyces sp. SID12488 TaxID=2706040 RepID=UPI0013D99DAA|nr:hypothetical protein [Streptomyces sp. SID12488]NEA66060.1 hypothetical protein [Streptomyces sp. SID12488]